MDYHINMRYAHQYSEEILVSRQPHPGVVEKEAKSQIQAQIMQNQRRSYPWILMPLIQLKNKYIYYQTNQYILYNPISLNKFIVLSQNNISFTLYFPMKCNKVLESQVILNIYRSKFNKYQIIILFKINTYSEINMIDENLDKINENSSSNLYYCQCQKSYKSYAAVYTHIKNKHNLDTKYLKNITRPNWVKTQKGRPRKYQQPSKNDQYKKLEIIQKGFLLLMEKLQQHIKVQELVLAIDKQFNQEVAQQKYQQLIQRYGEPPFNNLDDNLQRDYFKNFCSSFSKHSTQQIWARINWTLNSLSLVQNQDKLVYVENEEQIYQTDPQKLKVIWYGVEGVGNLIYKIYSEWASV